ncbi:hypothetical protein CCYN74_90046 [Capnocytophaga cynodegmi]|uniref:Uncharacterized protein n=1 Tax=Capnocytophaga cynodegmi TaxID=28189 RepID=A0A0B7HVW2_9FLAO|nr:hypothetical protein CCYN74_90046 [Capnocytophaga cynodegmi]
MHKTKMCYVQLYIGEKHYIADLKKYLKGLISYIWFVIR